MNDNGIELIKSDRPLRMLNIQFRRNEKFQIPNLRTQREPKLFSFFPECKSMIQRFCNEQIKAGSMSTDSVTCEIKSVIIPKLYDNLLTEAADNKDMMPSYDELLHMFDLKTLSISTVWRWLQLLGYKYCENKRNYYTDGHEREDVVKDRNNRFLIAYFKNERRTHRWVQISEKDAIEIEETNISFPRNCSYKYVSPTSTAMREYHVDTHDILYSFVPTIDLKYGGSTSVRKPDNVRPLMMVGQDESTYHQYLFGKKSWTGPEGYNFILPKGVGEILMISGYQAREFGLGLGKLLSPATVKEINDKRRNCEYKSKEDAMLICGGVKKQDLTDDPCLRFFRSGMNHDGYWNGSHSKIQLEDVVDCLSHIFPHFDFCFLFDQSSGHTKMRPDGLNLSNMNISYGGAVCIMRDTTVSEIGKYHSVLNVGDTQKCSFESDDKGPFWMTDEQKLAAKNDIVLSERITKNRTKTELLIELRKIGIDTTVKRFLKSELIVLAIENNVPISISENVVIKGWVNAPKGMLQILWERGFIDDTQVKSSRSSRYSKDGRKDDVDASGKLTEEGENYSLNALLMKCTDFRTEVTDLEHLAREISTVHQLISILFTPKFHCELAGEGIEYSWGASKR